MSTIDTIFIVRNMKYILNNQLNFGLQLVKYITHVLVLQLFKIVLHILNFYFSFSEYKHKKFKIVNTKVKFVCNLYKKT